MNPRERMLAGLIGLLLLMLAVMFIYRQASSAVERRKASITTLQADKERQAVMVKQGDKASAELTALEKRSLPKERETARSLYQQWLLERVDRVGFRNPTVRATDRTIRGRFYDQLTFQVDADGSLEQVVEFLHEFYSTDDLHRMQQLTLQPVRGSQDLDIIMVIEALILPNSQRKSVGDLASTRLQNQSLEDFENVILERSMFLPANIPPNLASIRDQEAPRGETFSVKASASDPDPFQQLSYSLVGEAPDGVTLNEQTGELRWTPQENGSQAFTIRVSDNGTPRRTDETTFQVTVIDPPPEEPEEPEEPRFDEAAATYVVGTILSGPDRQLWLMVRTTGQLQKLTVGDPVRVGSVRGVVHWIGEKEADIRTESGDLRFRVGQNLTEGKRLDDTAQQTPADPPS